MSGSVFVQRQTRQRRKQDKREEQGQRQQWFLLAGQIMTQSILSLNN
jgi:hypothetical protein